MNQRTAHEWATGRSLKQDNISMSVFVSWLKYLSMTGSTQCSECSSELSSPIQGRSATSLNTDKGYQGCAFHRLLRRHSQLGRHLRVNETMIPSRERSVHGTLCTLLESKKINNGGSLRATHQARCNINVDRSAAPSTAIAAVPVSTPIVAYAAAAIVTI